MADALQRASEEAAAKLAAEAARHQDAEQRAAEMTAQLQAARAAKMAANAEVCARRCRTTERINYNVTKSHVYLATRCSSGTLLRCRVWGVLAANGKPVHQQ